MKKTFLTCMLLITAPLVADNKLYAQTSPGVAMGGDLAYSEITPNVYAVTYKYYRNCMAAQPVPATMPLVYRSPGCQSSTTIHLQRVSVNLGQLYCAPAACNPTGSLNFNEVIYRDTLTLPGSCPNWVLSVTAENRMGDNLDLNPAKALYTETTINNQFPQLNYSPGFFWQPVMFAVQNQPMQVSQNAYNIATDSVVFAFANPLSDENTPVPFLPGFSASDPLGSFGTTSFGPFRVLNFTASAPVNTTFAARLLVSTYRKVNGVPLLMGTVSRDLFFIVVPAPVPTPILPITSNGQPLKAIYEIAAFENACIPITAAIAGSGPGVEVRITSNAAMAIPGATFTILPGSNDTIKTGLFCWQPRPQHVRPMSYGFQVTVRNNACPIPEFVTQIIEIKVVQRKITNPGPPVVVPPQPPALRLAAPNVITPNNDGKNDEFVVQGISENTELQVFDRNKKLVKRFDRYQNNWNADGLKDGTYFYIIKDQESGETLRGTIEVIR